MTTPANAGLSVGTNLLTWGNNSYDAVWDGVSDAQAYFFETQSGDWSEGFTSLGCLYAQRLAYYTGGASSDATTAVIPAGRFYNQVADTVTYANEVGSLSICDNYSYQAQGSGSFSQGNSYHGGRAWGVLGEGHEYPETITIGTAGQSSLTVPNGYTADKAVVVYRPVGVSTTSVTIGGGSQSFTVPSGMLFTSGQPIVVTAVASPGNNMTGTVTSCLGTTLVVSVTGVDGSGTFADWSFISVMTPTTDYADSSGTTIVLTNGAALHDVFTVYRGDPQYATMGAELDVFASAGTDEANAVSGNRIGLGVFAYRQDQSIMAPSHVGTLLNLVSDPDDTANLTVDRGVLFQGHFATGIDFTASNASFDDYLVKLPNDAGIAPSGDVGIGGAPASLSGYTVLTVQNPTNGGAVRVTDGTAAGRLSASAAAGVILTSETDTDLILSREGSEKARLTSTGMQMVLPSSATPVNVGYLSVEATSNTSLTFRYKGSDGVVRSASLTLS